MLNGGFREYVERDIWTRVRESNEEGIRHRYSSRSVMKLLKVSSEIMRTLGLKSKRKLADGKRKWVTIAYKAREGIDLDPSKIVSLEPWVALLG